MSKLSSGTLLLLEPPKEEKPGIIRFPEMKLEYISIAGEV